MSRGGSQRLWQLDLLRFIAVTLVLFRHLDLAPMSMAGWRHAGYRVATGGWIGVDLFFVLSGFLVSGLLFAELKRTRRINPWRFLVRRGFKIYPAFWALIATTFAFELLRGETSPAVRYLAELLFVQNYFPGLWNHTWSLGVEEQFYLMLALGLGLLLRSPNRVHWIPWICIVTLLGCLALRVGNAAPFSHYNYTFPAHLRIDSLMFGVLISYLHHFTPALEAFKRPAVRLVTALLAIAAVLPFFFYPLGRSPWVHTFGFSLLYLASGALLVSVLYSSTKPGRVVRSFSRLGFYSYSIYLWHMPVDRFSKELWVLLAGGAPSWPVYALIYLGGSILLGVALAKIIEKPALKLRDRWFPSRAPGAVTLPSPT